LVIIISMGEEYKWWGSLQCNVPSSVCAHSRTHTQESKFIFLIDSETSGSKLSLN
jgi:hypothetical protein